ncbi:MAG: hypothetical protein V1685_07040 [Parcubacteria group bacterium]
MMPPNHKNVFKAMLVAIDELRAKADPPKLLASQEEVDAINNYERSIGAPGDWKPGDHCYVLRWSA